ncbi:cobalamin B12-binding domain-containing protein [Thermosulfurimonas marina]|uniref:Cobalamin B12-binding domain-containing protein n=1 Tax=Thermosulfurimonas marina TaxID=2047767 RepID=A0A6H1WSP2_9BACT|nr:cobalamin B12-binding domain-containing protein [Thermosulfurimonas marina]QJA06146.1 cobalamin B12-binding domain-containing protein [Thermosulfurimonas marina]
MAKDPDKLGIFVTTPQYMPHLMKIVEAAQRAGKKVMIFFTFKAVHLTKQPDFARLVKMVPEDDLAICADSYTCEGFDVELDIPGGMTPKQMRTQAFHGQVLEECGKYMVL